MTDDSPRGSLLRRVLSLVVSQVKSGEAMVMADGLPVGELCGELAGEPAVATVESTTAAALAGDSTSVAANSGKTSCNLSKATVKKGVVDDLEARGGRW